MFQATHLKQSQREVVMPARLYCPITNQIMIDPVFTDDGHTYEREAIEEWFRLNQTSPKTGLGLVTKNLTVNWDKKSDISEFLQVHPGCYENPEDIYVSRIWCQVLVEAIRVNNLSVVKDYLGRDPRFLWMKFENALGHHAFHLACELGNIEIAHFILNELEKKNWLSKIDLKAYADLICVNQWLEQIFLNESPKRIKFFNGLSSSIKLVHFETQDTLLHRMVQHNQFEAASWLVGHGVLLEARNREGDTALHVAAGLGYLEITRFLMQKGAYYKARNYNNLTPLDLAVQGSHGLLIELLEHEALRFKRAKLKKMEELETRLNQQALQLEKLGLLEQQLQELLSVTPDPGMVLGHDEDSSNLLLFTKFKPALGTEVDAEMLEKFLTFVVQGEQTKAEAMLKDNAALVLFSGPVTDFSGRYFEGITAFQYAVWALDTHMWKMLRHYLGAEEAFQQATMFETGSWVPIYGTDATTHMENLIKCLRFYIKNYPTWSIEEATEYWKTEVGGAQYLVPVHVINEYCSSYRSFKPCPNFSEEDLFDRSHLGKLKGSKAHFDVLSEEYNGGRLGVGFAIYRGSSNKGAMVSASCAPQRKASSDIQQKRKLINIVLRPDEQACAALLKTRQCQRVQLIEELIPSKLKPS